jgi:hypothetical protein
MAESTTPRFGLHRWSAGTDSPSRAEFDSSFANIEARGAIYAQGTRAARPAPGVPGRTYTVVGDPDPVQNGLQFYDDGTAWSATTDNSSDGTFRASTAAATPLTVQGAAGQTANLQSWRNDAGVRLAAIGPTGQLAVRSADPAAQPIIVRGAPGQTQDLFRAADDAGAILARITAAGLIYSGNDRVVTANATQTLLAKTLDSPNITGTPTGLVKADVGLDVVDNTADKDKPISSAQATALNSISGSVNALASRVTALDSDTGFTPMAFSAGWKAAGTVACRRLGDLVEIVCFGAQFNAAISVSAAGNINDNPIASTPVALRPAVGRMVGGRFGNHNATFYLSTFGGLVLVAGDATGAAYSIAAGATAEVSLTYTL